jgi:hypothetical protein
LKQSPLRLAAAIQARFGEGRGIRAGAKACASGHHIGGLNDLEEESMKVISDTTHGILDYITVAIFVLAPTLFGLSGLAAILSYALAVIHLGMTLLTDMPLGAVKLVPMHLHAAVEMMVGPVLMIVSLAAPSQGSSGRAFFATAGISICVVWLLSSYSTKPKPT